MNNADKIIRSDPMIVITSSYSFITTGDDGEVLLSIEDYPMVEFEVLEVEFD